MFYMGAFIMGAYVLRDYAKTPKIITQCWGPFPLMIYDYKCFEQYLVERFICRVKRVR